jgi:hypothetical protein
MRKIDYKVSQAIKTGRNFTRCGTGQTTVRWNGDRCEVRLWGNLIFWYDRKTKKYGMDKCGWDTQTTRARINAGRYAMRGLV